MGVHSVHFLGKCVCECHRQSLRSNWLRLLLVVVVFDGDDNEGGDGLLVRTRLNAANMTIW